jgi:hypothetical protein
MNIIRQILLTLSSTLYLNQPKLSLHEFLRNIDSPCIGQTVRITRHNDQAIQGIIENKTCRTYTISQDNGSEIIRILEIHALDQISH